MGFKLLLSGDRANFTTLAFDPNQKKLDVLANYEAPYNCSWVEPSSSKGGIDRLVGLSEGLGSGLLYTFEIDHEQRSCKITSQQPTLGAPGHFITLADNSALGLITYMGESAALYPISITDSNGLLLTDASRTELIPRFPYEAVGHGPNKVRQERCHPHQMLEDKNGLLYVPDLGADRVWILSRDGMKLKINGWLQCPAETGPRHAVFTPDESILYVIGELSHVVLAFDLSTSPAEGITPIDGFAPNIIPSTVHPSHQYMMDSSELSTHPTIPRVLYASNRWERHIAAREPHLTDVPEELQPGDTIAVILLSVDGKRVEEIKQVRTNVDVIRGMRLSGDGKYMVVLGQEGGGVEVYEISGERGDVWTLIAGLSEGLESGIKHAVWL